MIGGAGRPPVGTSRAVPGLPGTRVAFLVGMLLLAATALADAPLNTPAGTRTVAFASTLGGYGLVVAGSSASSAPVFLVGAAGVVVGPSMGHLLGGEPWRGAATIGGRALSIAAVGMSGILVSEYCLAPKQWEPEGWWDRGPCQDTWGQLAVGWGGVASFAGLTAWDLWDSGRVPTREARRVEVALNGTLLREGSEVIPAIKVSGEW